MTLEVIIDSSFEGGIVDKIRTNKRTARMGYLMGSPCSRCCTWSWKENIKWSHPIAHREISRFIQNSLLLVFFIQKPYQLSGLMFKSGYNDSFIATFAWKSDQLLIFNEHFISLSYMRI